MSLSGALLVFLSSTGVGPAAAAGSPRTAPEPRLVLAVLRETGPVRDVDGAAAASPEAWGPVPRIGRSNAEAVFWVRLTLESSLPEPQEFVLLPARFWPRVDLYAPASSGRWRVETSGVGVPLAERPVRSATPMFRVFVSPGVQVLYARMRARLDDYVVPTEVGFDVQSWPAFLEEDLRGRRFQGIYAGLILAMVLYNFFLFVAVRDRISLLYVLYVAPFGLLWTVRSGLALEMVWPAWPRWDQLSSFVLIVLAVVFGNRFVTTFLETRRHAPRLERALRVTSAGAVVAALLAAAGQWTIAAQVLAYASLFASLAYFPAGVLALRQGFRPARIYLLACGALILGIVAYVLTFLGALPRTFFTVYGVQIGSAAEALLLAFALGDRIAVLKREKDEAQERYHRGLEREVQERTGELAQEKAHLEVARLEAEAANRRLQELNERLAQISLIDDLTGVANRRHFDAVLEREWRRCARAGQPLSVVLMDVDYFKAYNDHHGHPAGDRCLQQVAGALSERCRRAGDLLARYGGEEFAVVLPGTGQTGAAQKGEMLRKAVEGLALSHVPGVPLDVVSVSVGVGTAQPVEGASSADLLARADRALYAAKGAGRNRLVSAPA